MKRILTSIFSIMLLLGFITTANVSAENSNNMKVDVIVDGESINLHTVNVTIDGENINTDMPSVNYKGNTLVPARIVSEKLGAEVTWDDPNNAAIIETDENNIVIKKDSSKAIVNGKEENIIGGAAVKLMRTVDLDSSKTMVPFRFIAESLGAEVDWDEKTSTAIITSKKNSIETPEKPQEPVKPEPNKILSIDSQTIDGKEAIVIRNKNASSTNSFMLSNPQRIVVDIRNTNLNNVESQISTDIIKELRLGQYKGKEYDTTEQVVRIVLDISEDYENPRYITEERGNDLVIFVEGTKKAPVVTPPTPPVVQSPTNNKPSAGQKVIVIDPGHGGSKSGASYGGTQEKDLALKTSLKTRDKLEALGYKVIMVRETDIHLSPDTSIDLRLRAEFANDKNADAFISVHFNAVLGIPTATGIETYYTPKSGQDRAGFAQSIQSELIKELGERDRGIKTANYYVTKHTDMLSVLTELGFISNPNDLKKINTDDYQEKCATAIANGIHKFFSSK